MEITLDKFRCFGEKQTAEIAPITLLVGENSSGKSSFLAALRYILDFSNGRSEPSFNKDPFFLGGYKNIAHHRGGRYGRDDHFSIALSETFRKRASETRDLFEAEPRTGQEVSLELIFTEVEGEPVPTGYEIVSGSKSISIEIKENRVQATVYDSDIGFEHKLNAQRLRGLLASRLDFITLEYFLRDLIIFRREEGEITANDKTAAAIIEKVWEILRKLRSRGQSKVLALAPVRTRPQRNYDPTQLSQSSEGDVLIGQLGRAARKSDRHWEVLKRRLEHFGEMTGLFDEIKVRKLGNSESNPFQILVKKSGREANIIDVGYGVSQILPLFIMLTELDRRSTLLIQQPEVHLHPSAQAALGSVFAEVAKSRQGPNFLIETHSDFVIDRLRLAIKKGELPESALRILFFKKDRHNTMNRPGNPGGNS
ncbi:ATP-binding protein, partial [Hyphomonas sp. GM-8P]|uniref:AAA family ATPase n=1 Tax=Hyphomonas sp. GM-8P TaxID=1280945 RepID=UPI0011BF1FF7